MRQLLHTLYVTDPEIRLRLAGETLKAEHADGSDDSIPLHQLENIVSFSWRGATSDLMAECARREIGLCFLSASGHLRYRVVGETHGNVLLRKRQYEMAGAPKDRLSVAAIMLKGKLENEKLVLSKFRRNHPNEISESLRTAEQIILSLAKKSLYATDETELRTLEAQAAKVYFQVFPHLILSETPEFRFNGRNRRPPQDRCNAMLSFAYALLTADCMQALECSGLDPCVGFFHCDKPGKPALALDFEEEFRSVMADRVVLRLINLRMILPEWFEERDEGIFLNEDGRRAVLREWNAMKSREIYLTEEKQHCAQGLLPFLQAQKLARFIRGDDCNYHTIVWR